MRPVTQIALVAVKNASTTPNGLSVYNPGRNRNPRVPSKINNTNEPTNISEDVNSENVRRPAIRGKSHRLGAVGFLVGFMKEKVYSSKLSARRVAFTSV
jgi:hypothetical protein